MTDEFPEESQLDKSKKHLAALDAFMSGPAYAGFQHALSVEIAVASQLVLEQPVTSVADLARLFELRGERNILLQSVNRFEDARVSLQRKVDEMIDFENENTTRKL